MFFIKKNWLTGYITIVVKGAHPELFFQILAKHQIMSWDIIKHDKETACGRIKLADVMKVRQIRRKTRYKLSFGSRKGLPFTMKQLNQKRPLIIGFLVVIIFIFMLSNLIWRVDITGLDAEIEEKVSQQLEEYGVKTGNFQWNVTSPGNIQKQLLADIPELLWVGVKRTGSAYHLEGVEKTIVEKEEPTPPGHLVATKEGVVANLFISKGQPMVQTNDVVYPGDILVSGFLHSSDEEDTNSGTIVGAEGEVFAEVWYKSEVTVPMEQELQLMKGINEKKHYLQFKDIVLPIWNFKQPSFSEYQIESEEKDFYFLKWKLPVTYTKKTIYQTEITKQQMEAEQARKIALAQARRELSRTTPPKTKIIDEKVLHESAENGKVKLTLYYSVLENIATKQPISQGD